MNPRRLKPWPCSAVEGSSPDIPAEVDEEGSGLRERAGSAADGSSVVSSFACDQAAMGAVTFDPLLLTLADDYITGRRGGVGTNPDDDPADHSVGRRLSTVHFSTRRGTLCAQTVGGVPEWYCCAWGLMTTPPPPPTICRPGARRHRLRG